MSWAMHQEAFSEISYTTDYGRHPFDLKLICWSRWVHFISYAHAILIDSSPSHLHVAASSYYSCQHGAKPFRTAENELLALDPEYSERNTPTASIIDSTILLTKLCHHVGPCMRDAFIPSSSTQFIAIIPRPALFCDPKTRSRDYILFVFRFAAKTSVTGTVPITLTCRQNRTRCSG